MVIELTPETARLVRHELQMGHFRSADELIDKAVRALHDVNRPIPKMKRTRAEAVAHIRENRKGVTLGGLSIKDLMNEGRP